MKITFVSYIYPYPNRGFNPGIERVIGEISHSLADKGHEVNVITTYRNGGVESKEIDHGVTIYRVNDLRNIFGKMGSIFSLDLLSINFFVRKYKDLLQSSDVIHIFTPFLVSIPDVPLISHFHHEEVIRQKLEYLYLPFSKYLWNISYQKSDAIISVSEYSANSLIKNNIQKNKIHVIPNGVDISKFHPGLDAKELTTKFNGMNILLYVGPITPRKGLSYLIEALPKVLTKHENTLLVIVGSGDIDGLRKLAEEYNVLDHVIFEGFVPEEKLPIYYNACDIFVFPSLQEGFGMVLIEAMACGKTVVASNTTAIPEVVGDSGLLVEAKNPEIFASSIINLLDDIIKRKQLEEKAFNRVQKNFTWDAVVDKLLGIYSET